MLRTAVRVCGGRGWDVSDVWDFSQLHMVERFQCVAGISLSAR